MSNPLRNRPRPRLDDMRSNYPIVRCNRAERFQVRAWLLSDDVFGLEIHYAARSHVCTSHLGSCEWCDKGKPTRWVGYVAATNFERTSRFILEFTPGVMPTVDAYVKRWKSLRAAYATLTRPSQRDTGKLVLDLKPPSQGVAPGDLPGPFDLEQSLGKIYGLPVDTGDQASPQADEKERPTVVMNGAGEEYLARAWQLPDGTPELDGQLHFPGRNGRAG